MAEELCGTTMTITDLPLDVNAGVIQELLTVIANDSPDEMAALLSSGKRFSSGVIGSPLHVACTYSAFACITRLLADGFPVNVCNKEGFTPLHVAALDGDANIVRKLLAAGADASLVTLDVRARLMNGALVIDLPGGRTPLHLAAAEGNIEAAKVLFAAHPAAAQVNDLDGATPYDVVLREGAKGGATMLTTSRRQIAELLAPNLPIPSMEELWTFVREDRSKQRKRGDENEWASKANATTLTQAIGFPADHGYKPHHFNLYSLSHEGLISALALQLSAALAYSDVTMRMDALRKLCWEITPDVYAFQFFPAWPLCAGQTNPSGNCTGFAEQLLDEIQAVEAWAGQTAWALNRPNSMNRYGVVLEDIGLTHVIDAIINAVVTPMVAALFSERAKDDLVEFPDRHAFTVRYKSGEDRHLDTHVDSSDITLNLCLGGEFTGGGVYFHRRLGSEDDYDPDPMTIPHPTNCPRCCMTHVHEPGMALLHYGDHIHGARAIMTGVRTNLIVWCRSRSEVQVVD